MAPRLPSGWKLVIGGVLPSRDAPAVVEPRAQNVDAIPTSVHTILDATAAQAKCRTSAGFLALRVYHAEGDQPATLDTMMLVDGVEYLLLAPIRTLRGTGVTTLVPCPGGDVVRMNLRAAPGTRVVISMWNSAVAFAPTRFDAEPDLAPLPPDGV